MLDWFHREPFFYTLAPPLLGANPVDEFLFGTRRGFCEHYASAFVVMLRAAGIPARVVTGYQGGTINPSGDYMIVRQSDAHAWAEALIGGQWRRLDPTAAVAPSRIQLGLGGSLPASEPIPLLARLDDSVPEVAAAVLGCDQSRLAPQRDRIQLRPAARVVARMEAQRSRAVADHARSSRRWRRPGSAGCSAGSRGAAAGRTARARSGIASARASLAPGCRAPRTKGRSPMPRARRARWPQFAKAFGIIGNSYAELRYGPVAAHADTTLERASALWRLRRAVRILPAAATLRRAPAELPRTSAARSCGAQSSASRSSPRRFRRVPQLLERLRLDLPHALARDADLARELLERRHVAIVEPVAPLDHRCAGAR